MGRTKAIARKSYGGRIPNKKKNPVIVSDSEEDQLEDEYEGGSAKQSKVELAKAEQAKDGQASEKGDDKGKGKEKVTEKKVVKKPILDLDESSGEEVVIVSTKHSSSSKGSTPTCSRAGSSSTTTTTSSELSVKGSRTRLEEDLKKRRLEEDLKKKKKGLEEDPERKVQSSNPPDRGIAILGTASSPKKSDQFATDQPASSSTSSSKETKKKAQSLKPRRAEAVLPFGSPPPSFSQNLASTSAHRPASLSSATSKRPGLSASPHPHLQKHSSSTSDSSRLPPRPYSTSTLSTKEPQKSIASMNTSKPVSSTSTLTTTTISKTPHSVPISTLPVTSTSASTSTSSSQHPVSTVTEEDKNKQPTSSKHPRSNTSSVNGEPERKKKKKKKKKKQKVAEEGEIEESGGKDTEDDLDREARKRKKEAKKQNRKARKERQQREREQKEAEEEEEEREQRMTELRREGDGGKDKEAEQEKAEQREKSTKETEARGGHELDDEVNSPRGHTVEMTIDPPTEQSPPPSTTSNCRPGIPIRPSDPSQRQSSLEGPSRKRGVSNAPSDPSEPRNQSANPFTVPFDSFRSIGAEQSTSHSTPRSLPVTTSSVPPRSAPSSRSSRPERAVTIAVPVASVIQASTEPQQPAPSPAPACHSQPPQPQPISTIINSSRTSPIPLGHGRRTGSSLAPSPSNLAASSRPPLPEKVPLPVSRNPTPDEPLDASTPDSASMVIDQQGGGETSTEKSQPPQSESRSASAAPYLQPAPPVGVGRRPSPIPSADVQRSLPRIDEKDRHPQGGLLYLENGRVGGEEDRQYRVHDRVVLSQRFAFKNVDDLVSKIEFDMQDVSSHVVATAGDSLAIADLNLGARLVFRITEEDQGFVWPILFQLEVDGRRVRALNQLLGKPILPYQALEVSSLLLLDLAPGETNSVVLGKWPQDQLPPSLSISLELYHPFTRAWALDFAGLTEEDPIEGIRTKGKSCLHAEMYDLFQFLDDNFPEGYWSCPVESCSETILPPNLPRIRLPPFTASQACANTERCNASQPMQP